MSRSDHVGTDCRPMTTKKPTRNSSLTLNSDFDISTARGCVEKANPSTRAPRSPWMPTASKATYPGPKAMTTPKSTSSSPRPTRSRTRDSSHTPGMRRTRARAHGLRSEEHTSELQSRGHLVCRLLLEKKKKTTGRHVHIE